MHKRTGVLTLAVLSAIRGDNPDERERVLKEIADIYAAATKV